MGSLRVGHQSDFTFTFHFHALEKEMATHSSVLAWRIPGTGEPGGLPSMGSHRVRHDWSDLAAAACILCPQVPFPYIKLKYGLYDSLVSCYMQTHIHANWKEKQVGMLEESLFGKIMWDLFLGIQWDSWPLFSVWYTVRSHNMQLASPTICTTRTHSHLR